ncbi:hypothetical protein GCM10007390_16700 [Persicitalea jodogahamensis]|uniref:Uncharacterized protein n=1 Tax=Persicitalea jodogahamensis TaxID=402147 RepID=A0A8J3D344_9BACT|nr:hypothetical protein GCM10007390_16700 [Persicitalea jodogahamensis]
MRVARVGWIRFASNISPKYSTKNPPRAFSFPMPRKYQNWAIIAYLPLMEFASAGTNDLDLTGYLALPSIWKA